jgi:uncharacterized protein (TIRG00374 family)
MKYKTFKYLLKIIISFSLMVYLAHHIYGDSNNIINLILNADYKKIFFAFFILILTVIMQIYRWFLITKKISSLIHVDDIISTFLASIFTGLILPASIGSDAVRIIMLIKKGNEAKVSWTSVLLDKISGLIVLLVMIIVIHSFLYYQGYREEILNLGLWISVALIISIVCILRLSKIKYILKFFKFKININYFLYNFEKILFRFNSGILIFVISFLIQLLASISIFYISASLHLEINLWACVSLFPIIMLASALPIGFAGWGIREAVMILAFAVYSVPAGSALITSFFFGFLMSLIGIFCGLLWVLNFKWSKIFLFTSAPSINLFNKFR